MNILITVAISAAATLASIFGVYNYFPLNYLETNLEQRLGATITTIAGTDTLSSSRAVINTNFSNLNTGKFELSDWYATSSATQISKIGTLTTGTWNANTIGVAYGGTGSTTLSQYQVLLGNGTGNVSVVNGLGTSGQLLTSNGAGANPSWGSPAVDTGIAYTWTGNHRWSGAASSTLLATLDTFYVGRTATSTIQGSISGTSQLQGYLNVLGTSGTSTISSNFVVSNNASTTNLTISGTCVGCVKGYERVTVALGNWNGGTPSVVSGSVDCSVGKKLLGGGWGGFTDIAYGTSNSYPADDDTWSANFYGTNGATGASGITVYAICANLQ